MKKFHQIASALALVAASAAQAAPVSFEFTGTLDDSAIAGYDAGTAISGSFTYDTDTLPAMDPQTIGEGFQIITYAIFEPGAFQLNIGGDALSFSELNIAIIDGDGTGEGFEAITFLAGGMTLNGQAGTGLTSLTLATQGTNQDLLTLALPATLDLADFDLMGLSRTGSFTSDDTSNASMANFTIDSLSAAAPVPEPSTVLSMLVGLGMMGGLMMKRRREGV